MTRASEYVKALVSGYPAALRKRRILVVLQPIIDDSGKDGGPVFVLAGFVMGVEDWFPFADAWQDILALPPAIDYFKMNEAFHLIKQFEKFSVLQRDERIQKLLSLILNYNPLAIRHVVPHSAYKQAFKGKIAQRVDYPYFLSVFGIIGTLFRYQVSQNWHPNDKSDFIFDTQGEKEVEIVRRAWPLALREMPDRFKHLVGNRPDHRDDKTFVPLQAADLYAWHVRRLYAERSQGKEYSDPIWKALSDLKCAEDDQTEGRLNKIVDGVKATDLVFEYDLSPKQRKTVRKIVAKQFKDSN